MKMEQRTEGWFVSVCWTQLLQFESASLHQKSLWWNCKNENVLYSLLVITSVFSICLASEKKQNFLFLTNSTNRKLTSAPASK